MEEGSTTEAGVSMESIRKTHVAAPRRLQTSSSQEKNFQKQHFPGVDKPQ